MNTHYFGEKQGAWQTPRFQQSKKRACELIDSGRYGLSDSDFWILKHTSKNGGDQYDGLVLSHNGCLKLNAVLSQASPKGSFRPEAISVDKDGFGGSLVVTYCCPEQGIYEVGEVSAMNCKQGYPYAMALKRCFDRVVLKLSMIAFDGIYGEDESDSFSIREKGTDGLKEENPVMQMVVSAQPGFPGSQPGVENIPQGQSLPMTTYPAAMQNAGGMTYPGSMPSQPISMTPGFSPAPVRRQETMSLETARNLICPAGGCKGKPMGNLSVAELQYWADPNRFAKYPEAKQAAVILLQAAG